MGGLVGSIFDLAAGNPTGGELDKERQMTGYDTGVGEGLTTAGATFDENILSGDPSKIGQALAPEISSGQSQVQQQADQNAQFGTRSGGTTASTAGAEGAERGNIINLVGGLQSGTASSSLSAGSNLLSQASSNNMDAAQLAQQRRTQELGDISGIEKSAASIATGGITGGASAGGEGIDPASFNEMISDNYIPNQGEGGGNSGLDLSGI